jgi:xylulokinase
MGSKDYINYRLTGRAATDFSYASGSGVYDLLSWGYSPNLVLASGLPAGIFPEIVPSTAVLGGLTAQAAAELDLPRGVLVTAGGVDNSCMALGARNIRAGRVYNSLGSSSWIAVTSDAPLVDERIRPFIFTHVMPGLFNSATSLFSAGSSLRWARDQLCRDLVARAGASGEDAYDLMTAEAARAEPGCRGLIFNPSLAGGSSMDASPLVRGAFVGLELAHTRAEMIRAVLEGVALELRIALDALRRLAPVSGEMLVVGGGSRSRLWRQIFADAFNMPILKTSVDQSAAALGAAVLAAVGAGLWLDFEIIDRIHTVEEVLYPSAENAALYERILPLFKLAGEHLAQIGIDRQKNWQGL